MKSIYLAFCSVIPWGLEPQSKEPESFILSIELRNQMRCKDKKTIQIAQPFGAPCAKKMMRPVSDSGRVAVSGCSDPVKKYERDVVCWK